MSNRKATPLDRIEELELETRELRALVEAALRREPALARGRELRLAKTVLPPPESESEEEPEYPGAEANNYAVTFEDWLFAKSAGEAAVSKVAHSAASQAVGTCVAGSCYLPEGATVLAYTQPNGHVVLLPLVGVRYKAVAYEDIDPDDSGEVTLWLNGAATEVKLTAWLNWAHGGEKVNADVQVWIEWRIDETPGKWVITGADCN